MRLTKKQLQRMIKEAVKEQVEKSLDYSKLDEFSASYVETALWSSTDNSDTPLDTNYDIENIDEETLRQMQKDCDKFQDLAGEMIEGKEELAGHDFWLTRNGHGAGFWDGDWPEYGDVLTELSDKFGEVYLYVEDGKIYQE